MTLTQLQKYLLSTELFRTQPNFMVDDDYEVYQRCYSYYYSHVPMIVKFEISVYYGHDRKKCVVFSDPGNSYTSYKLEDLDLIKLVKELDKFWSWDKNFKTWAITELRNYNINILD